MIWDDLAGAVSLIALFVANYRVHPATRYVARAANEREKKEDPSPSSGSGLSSRGADASEAA